MSFSLAPLSLREGEPQGLLSFLMEKGLLSQDQADILFHEQKKTKSPIPSLLVDLGFLTEDTLAEAQTQAQGFKKFSLKETLLDPNIVQLLPYSIAQKYNVLVFQKTKKTIQIILADGEDLITLDEISHFFTGYTLLPPFIAPLSDIQEAIETYYTESLSLDSLFKAMSNSTFNSLNQKQDSLEKWLSVRPVIRLIDAILLDAVKKQASDIHFEPETFFVRIRYRIDGQLELIRSFHKEYWPFLCARLKVMANLDITQDRTPQNGRFSLNFIGRPVDFRLSCHPTLEGENIVVRILDKIRALLPLENLGFSKYHLDTLYKLLSIPQGLFIVTGPTGCGKTTTLYSILQYLNKGSLNIMTLEEPVEYQIPFLRQTEIRENGPLTFAQGVRSILRQDPDILLIGEIRDEDTAQMAVRAAMTGHHVFTTLHTHDALGTIQRLEDLGVSRSVLAETGVCILSQRLVRLLCPTCKTTPTSTLFCPTCRGTKYKGRKAIGELLTFSASLKESLHKNKSLVFLLTQAKKEGFKTLQEQATSLINEGLTTYEEILSSVGENQK